MPKAKGIVWSEEWQERLQDWALAQLPLVHLETAAWAIGRVDERGNPLAVVLYERHTGPDIQCHIAAVPSKRWATRELLRHWFAYPFCQLGCARITVMVEARNRASQGFVSHLGFECEGRLRRYLPDGSDVFIFGMLREECRWIGVQRDGRR